MELDILQLDALALAAARGLEQHLVIEAESELRHPREVDAHLDVAADLGPEHLALRPRQEVHTLDHVKEHLVLTVLDAFTVKILRSYFSHHVIS